MSSNTKPTERSTGVVTGLPRGFLRAEGAALLAAAVVLYAVHGWSWWWFAALLFVPDLSMLGYLRTARLGALGYNVLHTSVWPVGLGAIGVLAPSGLALTVALVWLAHIGLDRALGYGLKHPDDFTHTHLGWIGRRR